LERMIDDPVVPAQGDQPADQQPSLTRGG
jgi:hypothetical protein